MYIYWLDLVGVFAFAFLGARAALQQRYNPLGVFACAFMTAVGGGTVRELLLNHSPFYFHNTTYLVVIAVAALLAGLSFRVFGRFKAAILVLDAAGMACSHLSARMLLPIMA